MANKNKPLNAFELDGFKLVPETTGKIIDSIWHNKERQELIIRFATGRTLTFKPIESEITDESIK